MLDVEGSGKCATSISLAFVVGVLATLVKRESEFPQPVLNAISIYLVFAITLKGGTELAAADLVAVIKPVLAAVYLALALPCIAHGVARKVLRSGIPDAAGLAALFGSVSLVPFFGRDEFCGKGGQSCGAGHDGAGECDGGKSSRTLGGRRFITEEDGRQRELH